MARPGQLLLFTCLFSLFLPTALGLLNLGNEPTVRLHLLNSDFVKLTVGNPGKSYTFRVNLTLSDIHFHRSIDSESHTVESFPDGTGTELIYLGFTAYRLPFHYAHPTESERINSMISLTQNIGTIGLGPNSPLWKYWRSFSLTKDRLTLGEFDRFSRLDLKHWPPFISLTSPPSVTINDATSYPVQFRFSQFDTYLPHPLFAHSSDVKTLSYAGSCTSEYSKHNLPLLQCSNENRLIFQEQEVTLTDGIQYTAIQHSHDDSIWIGRRFLLDYVLFVDLDTDQLLLSRSSYSFFSSDFNALMTLILFSVFSLWLLLALNRSSRMSETVLYGVVLLEILVYLVSCVAVGVNLAGFQWSRYLALFLELEPTFAAAAIVTNTVALSMAGLWLLWGRVKLPLKKELSEKRKKHNYMAFERQLLARLLLVTGTALPALWFLLLPEHFDMNDTILTLFCATALCIASSLTVLHLSLQEHPGNLLMVLLLVAHYLFLVFFNVLPIYRLYMNNLLGAVLFVVLYLTVFCLFPVFLLWAKIQLQLASYYQRLQQNPELSRDDLLESMYFWMLLPEDLIN